MFTLKSNPKASLFLLLALSSFLYLATIGDKADGIEESTWLGLERRIKPAGQFENDPLDNMEILMKWLMKLRNPGCMKAFSKRSRSDSNVIEALEKIEQLRMLYKQYICNQESVELRKYLNDEFNRYNLPNLTKMFQRYAVSIAIVCTDEMPKIYAESKSIFSRNNGKILKHVELFFSLIISDQLNEGRLQESIEVNQRANPDWIDSSGIYSMFVENKGLLVTSERAADIAYIAIEKLVSKELDTDFVRANIKIASTGQPVFNGRQARELFSKFITNSCKSYTDYFGPKVFQEAEFELKVIGERKSHYKRYTRQEDGEYYFGWAQYEGCVRLMNHGQQQLVGSLERIADQKYKSRATK